MAAPLGRGCAPHQDMAVSGPCSIICHLKEKETSTVALQQAMHRLEISYCCSFSGVCSSVV